MAKDINILAALMSSGELEGLMFTGPIFLKILIYFVNLIADKHDKPIGFILDNASFHKSKEVKECEEDFRQKKIALKFLPPDSPGLNRIEKLWYAVKYRWMEIKCRRFNELHEDLCRIFNGFCTKFNFAFYAK